MEMSMVFKTITSPRGRQPACPEWGKRKRPEAWGLTPKAKRRPWLGVRPQAEEPKV